MAKNARIIGHAGCWAHVRRKFVDAAKRRQSGDAHQMLGSIQTLYGIAREVSASKPEQRKSARADHSAPLLANMHEWLEKTAVRVPPKGLLGKAVHYAVGQWPLLQAFLDDGHLQIGNDQAENAIRPFLVGRKYFLFSGNPDGARARATFHSLIETAKANGLEPWAYLNLSSSNCPRPRLRKNSRRCRRSMG